MLVLKYLQLKSKFAWSLSTLAALLRQQLFFYVGICGRGWTILFRPHRRSPACTTTRSNLQLLGRSSWTAENPSRRAAFLISGGMWNR